MTPEEILFYRQRAAIERSSTAASTNPHVIEIHQKLADLYDRLLETDDPHHAANEDIDVRGASQA